TPPIGYDVAPEGGRLIINDAEAVQVREIFALYARYQGLIPVAEELNRRGFKAKQWTTRNGRWHAGRPLHHQHLPRLLNHVTSIGQVSYKGTVYPGEQKPLVDRQLFEQVQEQLQRQRRPEPKPGGCSAALLKGLLWCEACQACMVLSQTSLHGRRYRYYVCTN